MTVGQLRKALERIPHDREVWMSRDPEGNGFMTIEDVDNNSGLDHWNDVGIFELTDELRDRGYSDEDVHDRKRIVVLWP